MSINKELEALYPGLSEWNAYAVPLANQAKKNSGLTPEQWGVAATYATFMAFARIANMDGMPAEAREFASELCRDVLQFALIMLPVPKDATPVNPGEAEPHLDPSNPAPEVQS